jgi:hypothetical protein
MSLNRRYFVVSITRVVMLAGCVLLSCRRSTTVDLPAVVRSTSEPDPRAAIGTAILSKPFGNIVRAHLLDGTVVERPESQFLPTPDSRVVPHIGPLTWPAVFAADERRLWVWTQGAWAWLERPAVGFVAWTPKKDRTDGPRR